MLADGIAWIRLDYNIANGWFWTDNTPFDYDNWADGMPSNPAINSNCVAM